MSGPGGRTQYVAVSPDGAWVAASAPQGAKAAVIEVASGRTAWEVAGTLFAFSPDGLRVAGAEGSAVVLYDARTGDLVARGTGHQGTINSVAFSPDGGRFLTTSGDRTVRLWEAAGCRCVRTFEGHSDEVFTAVFHPDGKRIASGGRDRAVWLWDVMTGLEVARLPGHTSYIWSLAFSPDGRSLASGSGDGTVRLWDTAPLRERHDARRRAAVLRPGAEALVERLFREHTEAGRVVAALRADASLDETRRHAAFRVVLRRTPP
jgi:WD40 repeat protein